MRKLLNNRWFVTAMALLAVVLVWMSLRTSDGSSAKPAAAGLAEPVVDPTATEQPLPSGELATASNQDVLKQLIVQKSSRDPFASRNTQTAAAVETVEQLPDLVDSAHLTGIWTQNGATLLLLNDRVTQVGDTIGRLTIESASQDGIWLTHWKGRDFLSVGQIFVLKTPARRVSTP
jgi:hypothetical protein